MQVVGILAFALSMIGICVVFFAILIETEPNLMETFEIAKDEGDCDG